MPRPSSMRDGAFIGAVVFLSLAFYAPHLGFYSDDWAFLGMYATSADQSLRGLYDAAFSPHHAMRPAQLWLCAVLYRIFGMHPAGYHVVNAAFIILNPLLVYALARALDAPRIIALGVALTYGLLPNYSTDRYWYLGFAITLSMTMCLLSMYADVRAVTSRVTTAVVWKMIAGAALVVSVLSYEVPLPLLLVASPLLMVWQVWRDPSALTRRRLAGVALLVAINVALLAGLAVFKVRTTVRLGAEQGIAAQVGAIARHAMRTDLRRDEYGLNVVNAVKVHGIEYGLQLLPNAVAAARTAPFRVRALGLLAVLGIFAYLAWTFRDAPWPSLVSWGALGLSGAGVFALGYAIFLTNYNVQFTPTGIANRSAIVAALGAAMGLVAAAGTLAHLMPSLRARRLVYAAALSAIGASGLVIVNAVAGQWRVAYETERTVLSGIRERFPAMPPNATLLLDGVCPYLGPAVVFEADWDLTGALQVYYRNRALTANVVTPRMTVDQDAVVATIYGQPTRYPYSSSLFVYHAGTNSVQVLPDATTARAWLSRSLAAWPCPAGREGVGVEPF